jgi:hypothetical protein
MALAILADPAQIVMLGISQENVRTQVPGLGCSLKPPCRASQVREIQSWVDRDQNIGILGGKLVSRQRAHEGNTVKAGQPADLMDKGPRSRQQELARVACGDREIRRSIDHLCPLLILVAPAVWFWHRGSS